MASTAIEGRPPRADARAVFVDSSALVAYLDPADGDHARALAAHASLVENHTPLVTTVHVFVEVVSWFARRVGAASAVTVGRTLLSSRWLDIRAWDRALAALALAELQRFGHAGASFVDCTSFAFMRSLGIRRAFTYDRHFATAGFQPVG